MSKEKLHWGCWVVFIAFLAFSILVCIYKTNKDKQEQVSEEKIKVENILNDSFVYLDIHGVYHIKHDCYRLNDIYYTCDDEEKRGNYSSQYISRSTITDWHDFAATHQLCSECFTPNLIQQLDSVLNKPKGWGVVSPYIQKDIETEDEHYRDADEEYYNTIGYVSSPKPKPTPHTMQKCCNEPYLM